ncbi:hypothetical protein [Streptomyces sp. NPDC127098]
MTAHVLRNGDEKQPGDDEPTEPGRTPGDSDDGRPYNACDVVCGQRV